ncbi:MAG: MATE family efflux transporter [Lachnospiraceae bacterium]|jgi:putative MATE family efflux protein|nr:MATE family efflux transporter [Lachnospiraceae bacterium]MCH4071061.1 MATE family efflux transporter [Lachnospiraceae bacterium]MCH4108132.1 MATE family efflux transporter [Lachnospiraceae bacterium]MCI1331897.1 MATE family efflux transporter [Lachnospiraceae bacterium]MCI1360695.1 MATE family efflux transporter [Lachnospiraceae bacterium]
MKDDKSDFTQGSIPKKMIRFMIPILGALVLQAMYGAVDLLVVGRFGTTAGLSAVSTGSQILNLVTFVITALATGLTVLIARYIGEKNFQKIGPLIGGTTVLFLIISAILFIIMVFGARNIALLMQAPEEAVDLTAQYVRICGAGIFFIVAYNVIAAIFRGLGDSRSPLLFVLIACIINVFGDLFLVAGLHTNVAGAAIATVAAQAVSVVISLVIMFRRTLPFRIHAKDFRLGKECAVFLRIGTPLALQEFMTQLSFIAICAFVNALGLTASSGYGVACKIVNFAMLIPSALTQSMSSFISQNVGAGKEDRARKAMLTGMTFGVIIGTAVFALIWFRGDLLTGIFTADTAVVSKGFEYLRGFAPETIVTAVLFSFLGYFNGHEKTVWTMVQGLAQTFLVRLPLSYFQSIQPNASLTAIGLASPTSTIFGILLNTGYFIWMTRQMKKKK